MRSPTDQPQAAAARRSTDSPTLWLSLALGSVLIHLVLFIITSVLATRTAKVELEMEPIGVEFVDPNATAGRAAAPSRAIAMRPGAPSSTPPSNFQAQPAAPRSQPSDFNPPVEQPFTTPPLVKRRRVPVRPQPQQPDPFRNPIPQPTTPSVNPSPFQPNLPLQPSNPTNPSQGQPLPTNSPSQRGAPGAVPNPSNSTSPLPAAAQPPVEGDKITQPTQGESVAVNVLNASQPSVDVHKQPAQPIGTQKNLLISYSSALAHQTIRLQATLVIAQNGSMLSVEKTTLLSPVGAIDPETLNEIASQIFRQWQFRPALDASDGKPLTPQQSNLIIDAQVQLP